MAAFVVTLPYHEIYFVGMVHAILTNYGNAQVLYMGAEQITPRGSKLLSFIVPS